MDSCMQQSPALFVWMWCGIAGKGPKSQKWTLKTCQGSENFGQGSGKLRIFLFFFLLLSEESTKHEERTLFRWGVLLGRLWVPIESVNFKNAASRDPDSKSGTLKNVSRPRKMLSHSRKIALILRGKKSGPLPDGLKGLPQ